MPSIFDALNLGRQALQVHQYALEITQRNIANVNTDGYSRERVNLIPGDPNGTEVGTVVGVSAGAVEEFRNRFIDYRISRELQLQGEAGGQTSALNQVEAFFNEVGGQGLQTAISRFFNSFSALSAAPEDMTLRRQVLTRGAELSAEFRRLYAGITAVQRAQDQAVADTVGEINELTRRIARLNAELGAVTDPASGSASMLRDQRQRAIDELSALIDVAYYETESGAFTVTTRSGALLVVSDTSRALETSWSASFLQVSVGGVNITSQIESGRLGGILNVRDTVIPGYLDQIDELAATLIDRVNTVHAQGVDYTGNAGGAFFVPFVPPAPGSFTGAASSMAVAITDPRLVAAAAPSTGPGNNANALSLAAVADEKLLASGTSTAVEYYAGLLFQVGSDARAASESAETQDSVLLQLQNQRDSFSGVSLDEEAINIIRYQKAFEASARFIRVVDELTGELVRMLG